MPSSGSTTSRIASSMSSIVARSTDGALSRGWSGRASPDTPAPAVTASGSAASSVRAPARAVSSVTVSPQFAPSLHSLRGRPRTSDDHSARSLLRSRLLLLLGNGSLGRGGETADDLGRGVLPGHPAQQRALDPRRVLRDAGERDRVLQDVLVRLDRAA